jgi:hypothetical protein
MSAIFVQSKLSNIAFSTPRSVYFFSTFHNQTVAVAAAADALGEVGGALRHAALS